MYIVTTGRSRITHPQAVGDNLQLSQRGASVKGKVLNKQTPILRVNE